MAFTTWADLKRAILDDLASGAWRTMSSYSLPNGRTVNYRSLDELKALLDFVKDQEALESGTPNYFGRTRAGNGGRG